MHDPQGAHRLYDQVIEFVGVGAAAGKSDGFAAVDSNALSILLDQAVVAGFLDLGGDFVQSIVPRYIFPIRAAGPPDLRLEEPPFVHYVLLERRALGANRAAIDGMVRVPFDVDHLRSDVFGAVADGIDDDAAAHRAIRAGRTRLAGAGDLELAQLRVCRLQIETKYRRGGAANRCEL